MTGDDVTKDQEGQRRQLQEKKLCAEEKKGRDIPSKLLLRSRISVGVSAFVVLLQLQKYNFRYTCATGYVDYPENSFKHELWVACVSKVEGISCSHQCCPKCLPQVFPTEDDSYLSSS